MTVSFLCAGGKAPINCPAPVTVATQSANVVASRTATDSLGIKATAPITLKIDKTPPVLNVTSPANNTTVLTPALAFAGRFSEGLSGIAAITCNGAPAVVTAPAFTCSLTLAPGANRIDVRATDVAGNAQTSTLNVTLGEPLTITGTPSPVPNAAGWNSSNVTVTYTCAGGGAPQAHEVYAEYSIEDFERKQAAFRKLGF